MRWLTWWLHRAAARLGWPGVAGGVVLLISLWIPRGILTHELARHDDLRALSVLLTSSLRERQNQPTAPDSAWLLTRFSAALPVSTAQQRMEVIANMQSAAIAEGLAPEEMSFQFSESTGQAFTGLDMVLPVKGRYEQLRRFVARVLSDHPALALEGFTFNRQSVSDAALETQLRFTLYLRTP